MILEKQLMAAVASNHVPEGLRGIEDEHLTEPKSSRFTAVNGQAPPPGTNGHEAHPDTAEEFNARADPQAGLRQPSPSPSPDTHSRTPSRQHMETHSLSPAKRKRSYPDEDDNRSNLPYHAHALPPTNHQEKPSLSPRIRMPTQNGRFAHDEQALRQPELHLQPTNGVMHYEQERPQPLSSHYDPHAQPSTPYYTRPPDDAEARMAEALQRGTQTSHPPHMRADYGSPEDDDGHNMQEYGKYSTQRSSMSGDGKRRKRIFSNRTKTGCLTCRKRKKKCDEAHPECNNCHRGGFICEGYPGRNNWQKPPPSKAPVPLQSKVEYAQSVRAQQAQYPTEVSPEFNGGSPVPSRQQPPMEGARVKPIMVDEEHEHPHSSYSPPDAIRSQSGWVKAPRQISRSYQTQPPPPSKYSPEPDYRSLQNIHEAQQEVSDALDYPSSNKHRSHSGPFQPTSSASQASHNAPAVAQAALQHTSSSQRPSPNHRYQLTEREKMLRGEHYLPYTPALMEDRERCSAAVWHFNNSSNPTTGISPAERLRFFKAIINLRPSPETTPDGHSSMDPASLPYGSVGSGVIVEAPFHCDYGYNINIGRDVLIGPDCRITDTCPVTIGNNVVFSPNVKLVCTNYAIDPRERRKAVGRALGRSIVIEDDCWIGSNVTITPGIKVGRCSVVGAGSLICRDVPPYTVVAGNPSKVVRGIYEDHRE